jgi:hypothetical protein
LLLLDLRIVKPEEFFGIVAEEFLDFAVVAHGSRKEVENRKNYPSLKVETVAGFKPEFIFHHKTARKVENLRLQLKFASHRRWTKQGEGARGAGR